MKTILKSVLIILSFFTVFSTHAVEWQEKVDAQLPEVMMMGLSGPFPMFFIMDENNNTLFYGKGIQSKAYQQFANVNFPLKVINDDMSEIANHMLPNLIARQSDKPLNKKKLVVLSLDEESFKTPEQSECEPCRALFNTIDTNQKKLSDMDKLLINIVHKNK